MIVNAVDATAVDATAVDAAAAADIDAASNDSNFYFMLLPLSSTPELPACDCIHRFSSLLVP